MYFEEYMVTTGMDEQTENSCAWKFYKELYRVGQQSKQEEVNKLQKEIDTLKAELAKYQREGYKLVPVEPTQEMLNVGMKECTYNTDDAIDIYKAMIGAAE